MLHMQVNSKHVAEGMLEAMTLAWTILCFDLHCYSQCLM